MKLGTRITLASLTLATLGLAAITSVGGCSSKSTDNGGTSGGKGWPARPSGAAPTTSTAEHNYALHKLYLGDTDRKGVQSDTAWRQFGYNIDGKTSDKTSTDTCTLAPGALKSVQTDGDDGIDNSFGENILQIIITSVGDAPQKINDSINKGDFTVMIDTVGLTDDPSQTNVGLSGKLFAAGTFGQAPNPQGAAPSWTTADNWPVAPEFVTGGSVASPKISFANAYVVNGTYVNGDPTDVQLSLGIQGVTLTLNIHRAILTFNHQGAKGANGTIAGVINTEELIQQLRGVAGNISKNFCTGTTFDAIADQIRQASDILSDGTNQAGKPCDAISIGLGFDADEIGKPQAVGVEQPGVNKCTEDAGATGDDGGGSMGDDGGGDASMTTDSGSTDGGAGG